jgi:cyclin-dependent kinase-like
VKLCDFGFARQMKKEPGFCYTDYVSTRWYRAPELLVGDAAYNESVDVWAIGCIFAEIYNGMPLFPGDSDLHTLQLILETITADDMESSSPIQELSKKQRAAFRMNPLFDGMKAPLASEAVKAPEHAKEVSLVALLKDIDELSLDFIRKCLVIDGNVRCKTKDLLEHPIFDKPFVDRFEQNILMMQENDMTEEKRLM